MALRIAEKRSKVTKSRLVSGWRNEVFTLSRFFIRNGDWSFVIYSG